MLMQRIALLAFLAIGACAPSLTSQSATPVSPQPAEAKPAQERVAADMPRVTPGGATFTVPAGWSIVTGKDLVILEPPEADTHVAIVDSRSEEHTSELQS